MDYNNNKKIIEDIRKGKYNLEASCFLDKHNYPVWKKITNIAKDYLEYLNKNKDKANIVYLDEEKKMIDYIYFNYKDGSSLYYLVKEVDDGVYQYKVYYIPKGPSTEENDEDKKELNWLNYPLHMSSKLRNDCHIVASVLWSETGKRWSINDVIVYATKEYCKKIIDEYIDKQ